MSTCTCPCIDCSNQAHWMCQRDHGQMVNLGDGISVCLQPGAELSDAEKVALHAYFVALRTTEGGTE